MRRSVARDALWMLLIAATLVAVVAKITPGQRVLREGDTWLKWSHDAQEEYVWGFSAGYAAGYEKACRVMDGLSNGPEGTDLENDPLKKCFAKEVVLSRGVGYYVDAVTDFYTRYPGNRDIMIGEVLEQLARGLTVDQVHRYPFPRHSPNPGKP